MFRSLLAVLAAFVMAAPSFAGGAYVNAYGGVQFSNDFGGTGPQASFEALHDAGYVAGVAIGTHVDALPGARVEFEASWRHSALTGTWTRCKDGAPLGGSDGTFAALANAVYDFDMGALRHYVLAGAGYGARRIVIEPAPDNFELNGNGANEAGFAWQLGLGANYALDENASLGIGYRYFVGPAIDRVADFDGKRTFFEADGDRHAVIASATWQVAP